MRLLKVSKSRRVKTVKQRCVIGPHMEVTLVHVGESSQEVGLCNREEPPVKHTRQAAVTSRSGDFT